MIQRVLAVSIILDLSKKYGLSISRISQVTKRSERTIRRILRAHNVDYLANGKSVSSKTSDPLTNEVLYLFCVDKMPIYQVAKRLECCSKRASLILKRNNVDAKAHVKDNFRKRNKAIGRRSYSSYVVPSYVPEFDPFSTSS